MKPMLCRKVPTSSGFHLATDIWLPDGPGPFPTLIVRTPYHRKGGIGMARRFVPWGYAVVVQDARGKFDSEGEFHPLMYEAEDGHDTIDWVANQSWCNGRIGLTGMSYLGIVQAPAASGGHEALKCISPGVAPTSFFRDWIRYDGCFALANAVRWNLSSAVCPTNPCQDHFTWEELYSLGSLDEILERAGVDSPSLRAWVGHDQYDEYWEAIDQHRMYERIRVPGFHIGGWFDHLTRGQFDTYRGIRDRGATEEARKGQHLFIGPWGHSTVGTSRRYGDWDFGIEGELSPLAYERQFLDYWLKGEDNGFSDLPAARVFLMGENRWIDLEDWPPPAAETQTWYLRSGGSANTLAGDGHLGREEPLRRLPDRYLYDPLDPVPTHGGPIYWGLSPLGPVDQRPILGRQDVLCYKSQPLEEPMAVVGEINLDLWIASDAADTDFIAKLCVIEESGAVTVLTLGSLRCRYRENWSDPKPLERDQPTRIRIQMGNLAYVYPAGSRIALLITSSSFPRILPHPNTMAPTWSERNPQKARQQVFHEPEYRSQLELPVLDT